MPPIYVIHQGAKLRINNRRLQIERDGETLSSLPLAHISEVILFGNIGLTTPAIDTLLSKNIEVIFLTQSGRFRGRLVGSLTPHVPLRQAQYGRLDQAGFVLDMAKGFVTAKLEHMKTFLLRHNRQQHNMQITGAVQHISKAKEEVTRKTTLLGLLGLEGAATAAYFGGYRLLFSAEWKFERHNRRPPRDPVNALLSLGYTLLVQLTNSAVQSVGIDPYAGFLHQIAYNRPAMALDLAEEFRPVVDGIVLWCCNSGNITPSNFSMGSPERPVILDDAGQRVFIQAFENRMNQKYTHPLRNLKLTMRQCLQEQARQIGERIIHGLPGYTGMGFK
jgi:CRISPR-associated protein Cas1